MIYFTGLGDLRYYKPRLAMPTTWTSPFDKNATKEESLSATSIMVGTIRPDASSHRRSSLYFAETISALNDGPDTITSRPSYLVV